MEPIFPQLFLLISGLLLMFIDGSPESRRAAAGVASAGFLGATVIAILLFVRAPLTSSLLGPYLAADTSAFLGDALLSSVGLFCVSLRYTQRAAFAVPSNEFYLLAILATLGAQVLARSTHLVSVFVGLETLSLALYAMVCLQRDRAKAVEASLKYFLLGSFMAAVWLFGAALIYGASGSLAFTSISVALASGQAHPALFLLGGFMVLVGLLFKIGAAPFHYWTPDVYEGANTPSTALMAVLAKVSVSLLLLRIFAVCAEVTSLQNPITGWSSWLGPIAAVTMILGNVAALAQRGLKRMLAYSSVAHAGYLLAGMIAMLAAPSEGTRAAVLFYLGVYALGSLLSFGSLAVLESVLGRENLSIDDLQGLGRHKPWISAALSIGLLSLLGLPVTGGFFGKFFLFQRVVAAGDNLLPLAVVGALSSAVAAAYYLPSILVLYQSHGEKEAQGPLNAHPRLAPALIGLLVLGGLVLLLGMTPDVFWQLLTD